MKTNLLLLSVFVTIIIYANINYQHGINGMTLRDGGTGCICHDLDPTDSVMVWIEGPDTVYLNDTADYKIYISGGPAVVGGFNVATYFSIIDATDTLTQILSDELTHNRPKQFLNDTVFWDFSYIAPDSLVADTLYATGNSTNNDSIPTSIDQWNHAQNFVVHVLDKPVFVNDIIFQPDEFVLHQNYPNPFNPSTMIAFSIIESGLVSLLVYDALGNQISTLVDEHKSAGTYEVEFNSEFTLKDLASGVYFYQLKVGSFVQSKKMLLIK